MATTMYWSCPVEVDGRVEYWPAALVIEAPGVDVPPPPRPKRPRPAPAPAPSVKAIYSKLVGYGR